MRAVVFAGGRADLGPLTPVIGQLCATPGLDVAVATGIASEAADLRRELAAAGLARLPSVVDVGPLLEGTDGRSLVDAGAAASVGMAGLLDDGDVLVVLGDRWELPWIVMPAVIAGIPVVHLHGGEITEGAIDERVRHAVTKLADQHCVASEDAARRLLQMGEEATRVHITGAPGLDRYVGQRPAGEAELDDLLGHGWRRPLALFTYHPVTTAEPAVSARDAAAALRTTAQVAGTVLATHPGPDRGRGEVLQALLQEAGTHPNATVIRSLGALYPAVVAACDVVVGNSSSGIIEAAAFAVPAVDIGVRQHGRLRGANVLHAVDDPASIAEALARALDPSFRAGVAGMVNPYGDGTASVRIAEVVRSAAGSHRTKRFVSRPRAS